MKTVTGSILSLGLAFVGVLLGGRCAYAAPPGCLGLGIDGQMHGALTVPFSATKVVDITLQAHFGPGLYGEHILEFQLFTPDRHLYQSMSFPVASPGAATVGYRSVPGYPHAMRQSAANAEQVDGGAAFRVERGFPVGGTQIVRSALYGTWTLQAYLDGSRKPACPAASFQIIP